jgi:hypothetical protein
MCVPGRTLDTYIKIRIRQARWTAFIVTSCVLLVVHFSLQPYSRRVDNVLEIALLFILTLLTAILSGYHESLVFSSGLQMLVTLMVCIPAFSLVLFILWERQHTLLDLCCPHSRLNTLRKKSDVSLEQM